MLFAHWGTAADLEALERRPKLPDPPPLDTHPFVIIDSVDIEDLARREFAIYCGMV